MNDLIIAANEPRFLNKPAGFHSHIVEINANGNLPKSMLVAKTVFLNKTMAELTDVRIRRYVKASTEYLTPELGIGYSCYYHLSTRVPEEAYGEVIASLCIPCAIIVNVFSVINMNEFPVTAAWSTRTKQQAQELAEAELVKKNNEIFANNMKIWPLIVKDYQKEVRRILANKAWHAKGFFRRLRWFSLVYQSDQKFKDWYVADLERRGAEIELGPLKRDLEKAGVVKVWQ